MKITKEISFSEFEPWSGACNTFNEMTDAEKDIFEQAIDELYPEGIDETQLNDILWFDREFVSETIGRDLDEEEEEDDDEEEEDEE